MHFNLCLWIRLLRSSTGIIGGFLIGQSLLGLNFLNYMQIGESGFVTFEGPKDTIFNLVSAVEYCVNILAFIMISLCCNYLEC